MSERLEYLTEVLLKEGEITSDERPFRIKRETAQKFFEEFYAEHISFDGMFKCWENEEGEHEVGYMEQTLEEIQKATRKYIELTADDLTLWGPAK